MDMSKEKRSRVMSHIKSKDTKCELALRRALWSKGFRHYRKNYRLFGFQVDVVFTKKKVAVFCDSDFWHGKCKVPPHTNQNYWIPKLKRNAERDELANKVLQEAGWSVLRLSDQAILKDPTQEALKVIQLLQEKEKPKLT